MTYPTPELSSLPLFADTADEPGSASRVLAGPTTWRSAPAAAPPPPAEPAAVPHPPGPSTVAPTLPAVAGERSGARHTATSTRPGTSTQRGRVNNWQLVAQIRKQASQRLSGEITDRPHLSDLERRHLAQDIVVSLLNNYDSTAMAEGNENQMLGVDTRNALVKATMDALFGLGRLQPLDDMDDVENVEAYGADNVWIEHSDGRLEQVEDIADSDEELIDTLAFIATRSQANERSFSPAQPTLHLRLDSGSRLAASAWITPRPVLVIRRHRLIKEVLEDLVRRGMLSPNMSSFLAAAVRAKKSIVLVGAQGCGKTTMARALAAEIPTWEKVGTAETEYELHLHEMPERHPRCIAWEARPGSGERDSDGRAAGEITLDDIIYDSFRFNLSRLLVGEVRGREVLPMFKAMQAGAGSISTTHAHSAHAAIDKLVTCAMEAGPHVTEQFALRQIAEHIDVIVHIELETTGWDEQQPRRTRYISEIIAIAPGGERNGHSGYPADIVVYKPGPDGRGRPNLLNEEMRQLHRHGFDLDGFQQGGGA